MKYADLPEKVKEKHRARVGRIQKRKHAEAAIAAGREPFVPGRPRLYSAEERAARKLAAQARYREKNIERLNAQAAARGREKRAIKAVADGREPGKVGHYLRPPALPDDEKRERHRTATREHARRNTSKQRGRYLKNRKARIATAKLHKERTKAERPDHFRAQNLAQHNNRRARKLEAGGRFSAADVRFLWDQQRGCCAWCLKPLVRGKFHVDHFVPLARGGSNDRSNLRLLHKQCNLEKSSRDPLEHAKEHGLLLW